MPGYFSRYFHSTFGGQCQIFFPKLYGHTFLNIKTTRNIIHIHLITRQNRCVYFIVVKEFYLKTSRIMIDDFNFFKTYSFILKKYL